MSKNKEKEMGPDMELHELLHRWRRPETRSGREQELLQAFERYYGPPWYSRLLRGRITLPVPVAASLILTLGLSLPLAAVGLGNLARRGDFQEPVPRPRASVPKAAGEGNVALQEFEDRVGYFTTADLSSFRPVAQLRFRIVSKEKKDGDEK